MMIGEWTRIRETWLPTLLMYGGGGRRRLQQQRRWKQWRWELQ